MPHVMIATPSTGEMKADYVRTLVATVADLAKHGIAVTYSTIAGGDLPKLRSMLAARFLATPQATHLFFVDSDMVFAGDLCRRLLSYDKPMIGGAYRTRDDTARWLVGANGGTAQIVNGLMRCDQIGFGCVLIRRDALEVMAAKGRNLFTSRAEDADDPVSEDISFCRRWRVDCNGEIWALVDARIGHVGDYVYGADRSYLEAMLAEGKATRHGV
jgi:hypothetical protein